MSWLFGRRSLQATREKIDANWGVGFMEEFTKSSKLRQTHIEYIAKLEKVVEAARILLERQCIQKYREELKDALKELEGDNEQG